MIVLFPCKTKGTFGTAYWNIIIFYLLAAIIPRFQFYLKREVNKRDINIL